MSPILALSRRISNARERTARAKLGSSMAKLASVPSPADISVTNATKMTRQSSPPECCTIGTSESSRLTVAEAFHFVTRLRIMAARKILFPLLFNFHYLITFAQ